MKSWLSQNSHSWSIVAPFQCPMVAMPIAKRFPVGAMVLPSPAGIGRVNVPVITPVTAVHVPEPKRIGCTLIVMSGAKTKSAFKSSMCLAMPWVSWPSGQVTTMSCAWLSCSRSHFWLLKTSKSSTSKTLRLRSTAGAWRSGAGGGVRGRSAGDWASADPASPSAVRTAAVRSVLNVSMVDLRSKGEGGSRGTVPLVTVRVSIRAQLRICSRAKPELLKLFRLDAGFPHQLSPLRLIVADEAREFFRGVAARVGAEGVHAVAYVRIGEGAVAVGAEFVDDGLGGGGGGEEAEPADGCVAGEAGFGDGRELGQGFGAPGAGRGERLQLAGLHVLDHGLRRREQQIDLAGEEVGDRLADALVGNVQQVDLGHGLEELGGEVRGGARARGGVGQLAGVRSRERDQLADVRGPDFQVGGDDVGRGGDERHRGELRDVLFGERRGRAHEERVAVGGRLRHGVRADMAARAGLVLDEHLLLPNFGELRRHEARERVGAAAGRKGHDDAHRLRGEGLRGGGEGENRQRFGERRDLRRGEEQRAQRGERTDHSTLAPEATTTFAHFAVSAAMTLPKSAGVPLIGLPPSSARRASIAGSASARFTSALTFPMISAGVPLGMPMPNHAVAS